MRNGEDVDNAIEIIDTSFWSNECQRISEYWRSWQILDMREGIVFHLNSSYFEKKQKKKNTCRFTSIAYFI